MPFTIDNSTAPVHELPDDAIFNFSCSKAQKPRDYLFSSEDEYERALADYIPDLREVERIVRHESQHRGVAIAIGVEVVHYALRTNELGQIVWVYTNNQGGKTPKIGLAAMLAAPTDPSKSDIADIKALGYKGVGDVGRRVMAWNKQKQGMFIPVPLSFKG